MHRALLIQEVLSIIFRYCSLDTGWRRETSTLAALARTCRAFKDLALDMLWEDLEDLSPLVRCVPDAYYRPSWTCKCYSLRRPLTQIEWDILWSYARRVRSMSLQCVSGYYGLSRKAIRTICNPPATEPLFRNLRHLYLDYHPGAGPLLLCPLPALISLHIMLSDSRSFYKSIKSLAKTSQNLKELTIYHNHYSNIDLNTVFPNFICLWKNLQIVNCSVFFLDAKTLVHLSRMHALTKLQFAPAALLLAQLPLSDPPLTFSNLHDLELSSDFLDTISSLLSRAQLPVLDKFRVSVNRCPSKQELGFFFAKFQTSSTSSSAFMDLKMVQCYDPDGMLTPWDSRPILDFEDLRPCMTLSNLRILLVDINCKVNLTDSQLLTLASAWPRLECFIINEKWGWNSQSGITPNGFGRLLQTCPRLMRIVLAMDTRGYTEVTRLPDWPNPTRLRGFCIDVVDSYIEAESVEAITAFFANIASRSFMFSLWAGLRCGTTPLLNPDVCGMRWDEVKRRINEGIYFP